MFINIMLELQNAYKGYTLPDNINSYSNEEASALLKLKTKSKASRLAKAIDDLTETVKRHRTSLGVEQIKNLRLKILEAVAEAPQSEKNIDELIEFLIATKNEVSTYFKKSEALYAAANKGSYNLYFDELIDMCRTIANAKTDIQAETVSSLFIGSILCGNDRLETKEFKKLGKQVADIEPGSKSYEVLESIRTQFPTVRRKEDKPARNDYLWLSAFLTADDRNELQEYIEIRKKLNYNRLIENEWYGNLIEALKKCNPEAKDALKKLYLSIDNEKLVAALNSHLLLIAQIISEAKTKEKANKLLKIYTRYINHVKKQPYSDKNTFYISYMYALMTSYAEEEDEEKLKLMDKVLEEVYKKTNTEYELCNLYGAVNIIGCIRKLEKVDDVTKGNMDYAINLIQTQDALDEKTYRAICIIIKAKGNIQAKTAYELFLQCKKVFPPLIEKLAQAPDTATVHPENMPDDKEYCALKAAKDFIVEMNCGEKIYVENHPLGCILEEILEETNPETLKYKLHILTTLFQSKPEIDGIDQTRFNTFTLAPVSNIEILKVADALVEYLCKYEKLSDDDIMKLVVKVLKTEPDEKGRVITQLDSKDSETLRQAGVVFSIFPGDEEVYLPDHLSGDLQYSLQELINSNSPEIGEMLPSIVEESNTGELDTASEGFKDTLVRTKSRPKVRGEKNNDRK